MYADTLFLDRVGKKPLAGVRNSAGFYKQSNGKMVKEKSDCCCRGKLFKLLVQQMNHWCINVQLVPFRIMFRIGKPPIAICMLKA